ncbi:hypothetical protein [Elioraea sp.]|uniref:hypothetical protein n=1 Tax=Elioraea sp. TaxID=2185103 RepID=UPI0038D04F9F
MGAAPFTMRCRDDGIGHPFTTINHPWTIAQVDQMNHTIRDATAKRFRCDSHDQLRRQLDDFIAAYNSGKHLKRLLGLTPYKCICRMWANEPERFILNPLHQMPRLNT